MGWVVKDQSQYGGDGIIGLDATTTGNRVAAFDFSSFNVNSLGLKFAGIPSGVPQITTFDYHAVPTNVRQIVGQFTLEFYVYWTANSTQDETLVTTGQGAFAIYRRATDQKMGAGTPSFGNLVAPSAISNNALHHIAYTRNASNVYTLWIDGVSVGTITESGAHQVSLNWYVGGGTSGAMSSGYMSAFRLTIGVCRYTTTFTPSYAAWPTSMAGGDASFGSVALMFDGSERTVSSPEYSETTESLPLFALTTGIATMVDDVPYVESMFDTGLYRVYGTTKILGSPNSPVSRRVDLHEAQSRRIIRSMFSDPVTGAYSFDYLRGDQKYNVMTYDWQHNYRAVIADNLTPEAI